MKKLIALLLVLTALLLCACGQTDDTKKLDSDGSEEGTESTEGIIDENGDKINVNVSFAAEGESVQITLTNDTVANIQMTEEDQDVAKIIAATGSEETVKLTWTYQYSGLFVQDNHTYTALLTKCNVTADLECQDKETTTAALLAALQTAGVEDAVYAAYQKVLAGETVDAAELADFETETWVVTIEGGELADVQVFDAAVALTASYEFHDGNKIKSCVKYDLAAGTYSVREYNESGVITLYVSYGTGGAVLEKAEYTYFESGALKTVKRYMGVALDYECEYDEAGNVLSERDYGAENESNSDIFYEGDEMPGEDEDFVDDDEVIEEE